MLVTRDPAGRWQVIDAAGSQVTLVETLTGHDDRLHQAEALARDYADQQRAYQAVDRIKWPDGFCRRDIAWQAVEEERGAR